MCKEMPVIPFDRVVDTKRIIGKNGGPSWRRGTRVADTKRKEKNITPALCTYKRPFM
jgi:hypothetical protein